MAKQMNRKIVDIRLVEPDNDISYIEVIFIENNKRYSSKIVDIFVDIEDDN